MNMTKRLAAADLVGFIEQQLQWPSQLHPRKVQEADEVVQEAMCRVLRNWRS